MRLKRINDEVVIYVANAHRAYWTCKGNIRYAESSRSTNNAHNIGIILLIRRDNSNHDLYVVTISFRKEGTERTISEATGKYGVFRCSPLTFDKAPGTFASGIHSLFYINSYREKINALTKLIAAECR